MRASVATTTLSPQVGISTEPTIGQTGRSYGGLSEEGQQRSPRPAPSHTARLYEEVAALVKAAPVVAVSVNTRGLDDAEAREFIARVAEETGLPAADPFRDSAASILEAVLDAPKTSAVGF